MRLLKYPIDQTTHRLNALTVANNELILLSSDGHVMVWSQQQLVDTAFDKVSVQDLTISAEFPAELPTGETAFFILALNNYLFVGSEHQVIRHHNWKNDAASTIERHTLFECKSPSTITDIKLDKVKNVLFVLCSNPNLILLLDAITGDKLNEIKLDKNTTPFVCITDPSSERFTILCSDRSVLIYQFNEKGSYKQIHRLNQFVQVYPLHYKLTMSPQANTLPIINSVKGTSSAAIPATVLLDTNDSYKIANTIVSPSSNLSKVVVYSPVMYEKTNNKKGTKSRYNLLATSGSKDGTVLVWNSKRMKPLFNAVQVSDTPINDMVWSSDGLTLFAISDDGILYTFAFQPTDLGEILPTNEIIELQKQNKLLPPLPEVSGEEEKKVRSQVKIERKEPITLSPTKPDKDQKNLSKKSTKRKSSNQLQATSIPPAVQVKKVQGNGMEFSPPSYNVPKDLKRKPKEESPSDNIPKKLKRELEPMDFLDTGLFLPNASFSRVRLATPKIRLTFNYIPPSTPKLKFDVKNGTGNEQKPTIVTLTSKLDYEENKLFQNFIPKFITMCTAGEFFWACCTDDGTIYVYSDSGKRIVPPLILGVPISFLEACSKYLLCVTSLGEMYCWDIKSAKLKFPINNIYPLLNPSLRYSDDILTRAENITMCAITKNGIPLVTLSNGDGYIFDEDMETWLLVSDSWWAYGSQYWDMNNVANGSLNQGKANNFWNSDDVQTLVMDVKSNPQSILNFMERKTNDELNRKGRIKNLQRFARTILIKEGFENMEEIVTLSHLENRILVSLKLEENEEFSKLLIVYCIRLSELGYTDRLDDVLQWLYNDGDLETSKLGGKTRKELMKDVLLACANIRHVQRVTSNYATVLGIVQDKL
ncbi:hypothetical protein KAFR_0C06010 [Kazachstania africana CBS 2517]|uniref:Protein HIR n=1 Tax=Kazachstania africana (strain ATCC 22294 / BCRC 22015 / CBS 2517 / CECT 1963 / NBRC 1671 / NRRL Y-8276) TaxID=1071382 RepID=H2AT92_KAZAF|nr:hypothetical protein KAFR_0C06010 [Kazachstania africana CBS 2517]CCF57592.1 hypothetical protein KAFR_0C06010 [Kazachstania africana CBS 2517]